MSLIRNKLSLKKGMRLNGKCSKCSLSETDTPEWCTGACPPRSIDHASVVRAVKQFIGQRKLSMAYADKAPQFESAFKEFSIALDHSVPGRSKTNALP